MDVDALVVLDSDGQHDTNDIPRLLEPIMDGSADFTIGSASSKEAAAPTCRPTADLAFASSRPRQT